MSYARVQQSPKTLRAPLIPLLLLCMVLASLFAVVPIHAAQVWTAPASAGFMKSVAQGPNGWLHATTNLGHLYAVDADGVEQWALTTNNTVDTNDNAGLAVASDGTVYVRNSSGYQLRAYDGADGTLLWTFTGDSTPMAKHVALAEDGTIYVGTEGTGVNRQGHLYALDPVDGSVQWTMTRNDASCTSPVVGADGTIFVNFISQSVGSGGLMAVADEGALATLDWVRSDIQLNRISPAIAADGSLRVISGNALYAIDAVDGTDLWAAPVADVSMPMEGQLTIAPNGTTYVSSNSSGELMAVDATGTVLWSVEEDEQLRGGVAIAVDGTVIICDWSLHSDDIVGLSPADGSRLWVQQGEFEADCVDSYVVLGADGTMYASDQGSLVAFTQGLAGPATSGWSQHGHDPARTGNVATVVNALGNLSVTVQDAGTAAALPNATVTLANAVDELDTNPVASMTTDLSGVALFENLASQTYQVRVQLTGYDDATTALTVTDAQTASGTVNLVATVTTGSITGSVTSGGSAVDGTLVWASYDDNGTDTPAGSSTTTNAAGVYAIAGLDARTYTIHATKSGYIEATATTAVAVGAVASADLVLTALPTSGTVAGTILDEGGVPLDGVSVSLSDSGGSTTTDAAGVYSLPSVAVGTYTITVSKSGYVTQAGPITVGAGQSVTSDFTLVADTTPIVTGNLTGTVTDADWGDPIDGATLTLSPGSLQDTSDASGAFSISDIAAGAYTLQISAAGYASTQAAVTITGNQTTTRAVSLVPSANPTALITGSVVDAASGATLVGVTIACVPLDAGSPQATVTDAQGGYRLNSLVAGRYAVEASMAGYVASMVNVTIDSGESRTLNLSLDPQAAGDGGGGGGGGGCFLRAVGI